MTVELREVDLDAAGRRKIRSAISGAGSGEFEIGALEAGKRYALRVFLVSPDPFRQYEPHTDTLELARGERRTYDVALRRPLCGR